MVGIKKAGELLGRSGLQLPRVPSLNTDNGVSTKPAICGILLATSGNSVPTRCHGLHDLFDAVIRPHLCPYFFGSNYLRITAFMIKLNI